MKKYLKIILLLIFATKTALAQYPCLNGISTNPLSPINPQLPSKANTFFNWQDSLWQMQPSPFCFRTNFNESPFFKIDNLEELRESKDMRWDDGWELLRRYVGLTESNAPTASNPEHLYVILYNKYTGILRVILIICRGQDYNAAKITVQFDQTSSMKTDLLEFSRTRITPLNKKFIETSHSAGVKYFNENNKWFYADFPMMYDPCTCIYPSKLNITSTMISTATIDIEGKITGDIHTKNVGGKAQVQKPGTFGWKDFGSLINGKVSAIHGSVDKFKKETEELAGNFSRVDTTGKKNAIGQFASFLKDNKFLKSGLKSVPWLKSAISLVDVFSGGGKTTSGPQEVKLLPMSVNLTAKFNGTMTLDNAYHNIKFSNPGSKDAQLDPDNYPYYNEVLGVFNLLQPPVMYHQKTIGPITDYGGTEYGVNVISNKYHFLLDSLKYVLNPAAGLTIQNMEVAMIVEATPNQTGICANSLDLRHIPGFVFEGRDGLTNAYKFRTEYFDVKCFNENTFHAVSYFGRSTPSEGMYEASCWIPQPKVYLKFMINLRKNITSPTTQNVLYVATFPMNLKTYDIDNNFVDMPCNDSSIVAPATVTEVNTFCNSSVYYNIDRQARPIDNNPIIAPNSNNNKLELFPSPNNGTFSIRLKQENSRLLGVRVIDINGREVYKTSNETLSINSPIVKNLNLSLGNGMYILQCITDKGILKTKFMVQN